MHFYDALNFNFECLIVLLFNEYLCILLNFRNQCIILSKILAKFILRNMNQSADPCGDFYNFACGNFYKEHHIDGNQSVLDQLTDELHILFRGTYFCTFIIC